MTRFDAPPQAPMPSGTQYSQPSQWPTTIGAFAIAIGALGGLVSLWGIVSSTLLWSATAPGMPEGFKVPPEMTTFTVVDSLLGLVFAGMLLVGGIATIRRRTGGPKLLRNYAIIRLVLVVPLTVTQGVLTYRVMDQMVVAIEKSEADKQAEKQDAADADGAAQPAPAKSAGPPMAAMKQIMSISAVGGTVCSGLLAAVWPTVLLVLLANARRKEEVAGWQPGF